MWSYLILLNLKDLFHLSTEVTGRSYLGGRHVFLGALHSLLHPAIISVSQNFIDNGYQRVSNLPLKLKSESNRHICYF